jgi:hypothetical protein
MESSIEEDLANGVSFYLIILNIQAVMTLFDSKKYESCQFLGKEKLLDLLSKSSTKRSR